MDVLVNYWAVLAAAVVGWFVGWIWYGPLFGKPWMKWSGVSMADAKKNVNPKLSMWLGLGTFYLVSLVLAHLIGLIGISDFASAKELAFWVWLGFFVPVSLGSWLWEGRSFKLFLLNAIYWLLVLDIAAYVLVRWS